MKLGDERRWPHRSGRQGENPGKAGPDMAVTKTHPSKVTPKVAIGYSCNLDKTDRKLLVSSFGCTAETADIEFEGARRHAIGKGTHRGHHRIQAFELGVVLAEEVHEIGIQLAVMAPGLAGGHDLLPGAKISLRDFPKLSSV